MKNGTLVLLVILISNFGIAKNLDGESWLGSLNIGMLESTYVNGANEGAVSANYMDVTVGYSRSKGFYLGGIYSSVSGDNPSTQMGLSMGYARNGWVALAHYLLGGTATFQGRDYKEGTGSQIDIGYLFKTGTKFYVGVQYTSRTMEYKAKVAGGDELATADTYPAVKLAYVF